jgi:Domain of unknown function (DUF305)
VLHCNAPGGGVPARRDPETIPSLKETAMNRILALSLAFLCLPALAGAMPMKDSSAMTAATPATKGYMEAMQKMDKGMDVAYSGNADIDFVRGMIPHHQGAVDMCKVELQYGKDAQIRKLCGDIVSSQESQIVEMKKWLAAHEKK